MSRLTRSQRQRIVQLLEREIYDLCTYRLDPHQETYVGQAQHSQAEQSLAEIISAREKIAGTFIPLTPLWVLKGEAGYLEPLLANKLSRPNDATAPDQSENEARFYLVEATPSLPPFAVIRSGPDWRGTAA
jgi:hypothetical protein